MKRTKPAAILTALLNLAGIFCLVWGALLYLSHDPEVPNPDAMIPMTISEGGGFLLTFGLLPMIAANVLGFLLIFPKEKKALRMICFLPAATEFVLVAHFWLTAL